MPTLEPEKENPYSKFVIRTEEISEGHTIVLVRRCKWLAKKPTRAKIRICTKKRYQEYSEKDNLGPASRTCFETCAPYCVEEFSSAKFIYRVDHITDNVINIITRQCKWLSERSNERIAEICENREDYDGVVYGQASEVCTELCDSCGS
jgi:hypothetical protein